MAKAKKKSARPAAKKAAKPAMKSSMKMASKAHNPATCECPCHEEHCNATFCGLTCHCPVFGVITTRAFWLSSLLAFVVSFAFDMWWNGHLLMPAYEATAHLWRPMAEMEQNFIWCIAYHAGLAMAMSALVLVMGRTSTWWGALSTGKLAATPLAISQLSVYMFMPLPDMYLPAMWAVGVLIQGALIGLAVKSVTCCKSCR